MLVYRRCIVYIYTNIRKWFPQPGKLQAILSVGSAIVVVASDIIMRRLYRKREREKKQVAGEM